mgnify:FL=1
MGTWVPVLPVYSTKCTTCTGTVYYVLHLFYILSIASTQWFISKKNYKSIVTSAWTKMLVGCFPPCPLPNTSFRNFSTFPRVSRSSVCLCGGVCGGGRHWFLHHTNAKTCNDTLRNDTTTSPTPTTGTLAPPCVSPSCWSNLVLRVM